MLTGFRDGCDQKIERSNSERHPSGHFNVRDRRWTFIGSQKVINVSFGNFNSIHYAAH
jgi:hypothetical protein